MRKIPLRALFINICIRSPEQQTNDRYPTEFRHYGVRKEVPFRGDSELTQISSGITRSVALHFSFAILKLPAAFVYELLHETKMDVVKLIFLCCVWFRLFYVSNGTTDLYHANTLARVPKGVAANVAATASTKTQRVSMSPTPTILSRPSSIFYDDLPTVIPDSHTWRGTLSAEEKLVAQLLNRGSLTVRPNGHNNKTTSPVFVDITYNVIQILAFVSERNPKLIVMGLVV
ncbi:hypothetical protein T265_02453 [Opisthorchis viverrini]|uniref:Uncharacterized protein n=1 Tax=Opisthorchis viverrini TaxID=6198 RepID=A0A074ZZ48_OPIVI|nr:hypothetical protein T265_02453 [Opisthorchis viverrini]KER31262.1 hypothetical protein T265_02453 [Opisthorchis viverrini]